MTGSAAIASINCTSCGAGLDVLGGGRVQVHVCGYCGAELDAQSNYAVLRKFDGLKRPASPFRIGMTGEIKGVPFTIIGTLGMEERYKGKVWRWCDHQVYSPTHGYAYLTVEDGHFTFTRRYRAPIWPAFLTVTGVETSETRPTVRSPDGTHSYYDTSTSEIKFIEGEFNWTPELNARTTTVSALAENTMIGFARSSYEEEVIKTEYLPYHQTCAAFGVEDHRGPQGVHPLSPYHAGRHEAFLKWGSLAFAALSLAVLIWFALPLGEQVARGDKGVNELPVEVSFDISQVNRIARIDISANVDNSWGFIGATVYDPSDQPVFEAGRTVERYSGRDADGRWTEGNGRASIRFTPTAPGAHVLELNLEEANTWGVAGKRPSEISYTVTQGVAQPVWMIVPMLVFALMALYQFGRRVLHDKRRWWGSDWTDED